MGGWLDGWTDGGWAGRVNKWMKSHWSLDSSSSPFVWTFAVASQLFFLSPTQSYHLHCPPTFVILSPKRSYLIPLHLHKAVTSYCCFVKFNLLVRHLRVEFPPTFPASFTLIPHLCSSHQPNHIIYHHLSPLVISRLWINLLINQTVLSTASFLPFGWQNSAWRSRLTLDISTLWNPTPARSDHAFLCAHRWLYAYKLCIIFITWFCNCLPNWPLSQLSAFRNKILVSFIKAPSAWSIWETAWNSENRVLKHQRDLAATEILICHMLVTSIFLLY